ncbi:unnamed protein product [Rotaria sp. Silwood1]|nr:unnamed protein product [Rotaria sp. Silwood1]
MIRTLSTATANSSCTSNEPKIPPSSTRTRRFTLHSLATRLSDSKKNFLEQIPHHQQQLTRFRKRARSFLTSTLNEHSTHSRSFSSDERHSSPGIISVDEIYRRLSSTQAHQRHDFAIGIPAPKLLHPSTLINEEQSKQILLELPARVHALNWCLIFSTETHGFSLNQLYRRSLEIDHDSPALLIIKDIEQNIFGAFTSHQLMVSEGFYGTGESFLFTLHPEFRVFNWSGYNEFFVKGDLHSIGFGSGEGTYGLWLDADLYHGRTCSTKTFNNERLTTNEDFIIAIIMLINSKNLHSSIHNFYTSNSNNKIPQYYLSINNNHTFHRSSSSLSLSSVSSSLLNQSRKTLKPITACKRTNSLSSLSTTSFSSSITIILHALHKRNRRQEICRHRKKFFHKNQSRSHDYDSSSSSISLSQLINIKKTKQLLNETIRLQTQKQNKLNTKQNLISKYNDESFTPCPSYQCNKKIYRKSLSKNYSSEKSYQISEKENTTSFHSNNSLSNSISDFNEINNEENINNFNCDQTHISNIGTQTDNYSSIRQQYQYGSLRRVNSDLLDYIFIPISNVSMDGNYIYSMNSNTDRYWS